jgi:hypothetical protein
MSCYTRHAHRFKINWQNFTHKMYNTKNNLYSTVVDGTEFKLQLAKNRAHSSVFGRTVKRCALPAADQLIPKQNKGGYPMLLFKLEEVG